MSTNRSNTPPRSWHNWSGSVHARPREIVSPSSIEELARRIGQYGREGRQVRVVGSGHSFTPLVATDDVLMSLDGLQGILSVDEEAGTVDVLGGTQLKRLGDDLLARGLAQENLGDIDVQSIAGAVSTGTHGTGAEFGTLSTQLAGLTLVTASGDIVECSDEENPDLFKAAQVSMGALGVIARVKLRVVPAARHRYQVRREPLTAVPGQCGAIQAREQPLRVLLASLHQVRTGQVPQSDGGACQSWDPLGDHKQDRAGELGLLASLRELPPGSRGYTVSRQAIR